MQVSLAALTKKAINAALKERWQEAIDLNIQVLEKTPKDFDTKIRLGRAYIQNKDFDKAKKIFEEVLKIDPINKIALRNYDLAKNKKAEIKPTNGHSTKEWLMEPGTTTEVVVNATAKLREYSAGDELKIKIKKRSAEIIDGSKKTIGIIEDKELLKQLNTKTEKKTEVKVTFVNGKDKVFKILIKSNTPIFKADKQDVRPYMKKGSFDEPELETGEVIEAE